MVETFRPLFLPLRGRRVRYPRNPLPYSCHCHRWVQAINSLAPVTSGREATLVGRSCPHRLLRSSLIDGAGPEGARQTIEVHSVFSERLRFILKILFCSSQSSNFHGQQGIRETSQ
jgi:hypothetical protein